MFYEKFNFYVFQHNQSLQDQGGILCLNASLINNNIVYGLISGYVSLGLIGFFINLFIETIQPNSFNGLLNQINASENLLYYSYVTLLTIGFGEITPSTSLTQKTALIIGLCGEIYQALITAIIVGKYINQTKLKKIKNQN